MKFKAGDVIAGRYRVEAFHLEGGMQEVYRCYDHALDRIVAVKTPVGSPGTELEFAL